MRHIHILASLLVAGAFALSTTLFPQTEAFAQDSAEVDVLAVAIHADWCGYCQELDPKYLEAQSHFKDASILFVTFDFTDDFTTRQSELKANWTGLSEVFEEHKGSTGYVLLLDAETHDVIDRITHEQSTDDIRNTIAAALD